MSPRAEPTRAERLRSPLLVVLWVLLACEAAGGLVIFVARLVAGATPGETLHVIAGLALTLAYALYQIAHWRRVAPLRPRLDVALGLIAAGAMIATLASGLWLGASWWRDRFERPRPGAVEYAPLLSAVHNIGSMLVLTFIGAHVGAVLMRDRRRPPETPD